MVAVTGTGAAQRTWQYRGTDWVDITVGSPTSYTPVLTAASTNPVLGAGAVQSGRFIQVGKLVTYWFQITFGTTGQAAGSGIYSIALPAAAVAPITQGIAAGAIRLYDSSTGNVHIGARAAVNSTTTLGIQYSAAGIIANVGNAAPWVWAAGDIIDGFITYEAAWPVTPRGTSHSCTLRRPPG